MAEIEVVIKIPEEKYNKLVMEEEHIRACGSYYPVMILDGIPLPKGHGRLIDADWIDDNCDYRHTDDDGSWCYTLEDIDNAPTIIEADKAESEQNDEIPWYLKIFNQDILNEYQKRMRDATEVPCNDKGSSIHSEAYKEE